MPVNSVPTMGWTRRSAAVSVLLAMEEQRRRIGEHIRRLREERNWSQEVLAQSAGLSVKTVSRVENGRNDGRFDTYDRLAEAFGMSSQELLGKARAPLGLDAGGTQLDRVEAKLDEVLSALASAGLRDDPTVGERPLILDGVAEFLDERTKQRSEAPTPSQKAAGRRRKSA